MCHNKQYRMVNVSMSPNMIASIGLQKIALGYVKCKIYEVNASSRCYHCQRHGHFADNCQNKLFQYYEFTFHYLLESMQNKKKDCSKI